MASAELQRLWKLAQIDNRIVEIRKRAASLDVGGRIQAEIDALNQREAEVGGRYRTLNGEFTDLELKQKGAEDKLKRLDKELYGGKVVNPREVEAMEKEITATKRQRDTNDERLLELMDLLPPAKAETDKIQAQIDERKKALVERRKAAVGEKGELEEAFKKLNASRADALKGIPPGLLARYEDIRKRHGGIGMVEVNRRNSTCTGCGTRLPERSLALLHEDKTVTCETCHRILYYTEGLV